MSVSLKSSRRSLAGGMHPSWFRIGGVAQDLPKGWDRMVREFVDGMPARLDEFEKMSMQNSILENRTKGVGVYTQEEALAWGITGPGLRATGFDFDLRRDRPYGGYDEFDFEVPVFDGGDCYDRRECGSRKCARACALFGNVSDNMPGGPYKSEHHSDDAAAEGANDARHRDAHSPLRAFQLGAGDSAGRMRGHHRGDQG
ncbi:MAG: hypothetical protein U5O39_05835 [Gammaproteobacteria bacterium]|nr:hypothetical protein [Gammaproteobacteria bacterium]